MVLQVQVRTLGQMEQLLLIGLLGMTAQELVFQIMMQVLVLLLLVVYTAMVVLQYQQIEL